jgi:DNA-binding CsgD family transcriptional regulator
MRRSAYRQPTMRVRQLRLQALLGCVAALEESAQLATLPAEFIAGVARLVPCDSVTYNEVDPGGGNISWLAEPADAVDLPDGAAIFAAHMHEHPLIAHYARTPTPGALRISDLLNLRAFRRTGLYREFFGPLGITRQLVLTLPATEGVVIGIALDRARRDFSEEDRAVLDLLRPHLVRARANVHAREHATRTISALERAISADGGGVITLDATGRPSLTTPVAERQLRAWFPGGAPTDRELPDALKDWITDRLAGDERRLGAPAPPLRLACGDQQLTVRYLPASATGDPPLLLLDERRPALSEPAMRALGLTRREAEVLRCAARGTTNAQIARELQLSPATVKKHLEHIYGKLDVSSRGAAIARTLAAPIS